MQSQESEGAVNPKIVRGRVDSLSLYEITDYELQILEDGSIGTTYLNFAVFFLSVALSFMVSLLTTTVPSERVFLVFVVVTVVSFAAGFVLLVLWHKARRSMAKVIQRIKERCLPMAAPPMPAPMSVPGSTEASAG